MTSAARKSLAIGQKIRVTIEKIAHGGHCIARHEGAVIFVRHGIPGEVVDVIITSVGASFNRGDVSAVIERSPDRVLAPCKYANPDGCGGCDFQHISLERQRKLKSDVITEQFARIAKMEIDVEVEEVSPPLGWRIRATAASDSHGHLGFYKSRSHEVIAVDDCIVLNPTLKYRELASNRVDPDSRFEITASNSFHVHGHQLQVSEGSFWQGNINAPQVLTDAVVQWAKVQAGEKILDLYGGVGLFTAALLDDLGENGSITLIEGSKVAAGDAKQNFQQFQQVKVIAGSVEKAIGHIAEADIVLLDPPREGAGRDVVAAITSLNARAIIYIACDPAALARDVSFLAERGYVMKKMRAFDLFPMTHHIESLAYFESGKVS